MKPWEPFDEIEYNKKEYRLRTQQPIRYWLNKAYWRIYRFFKHKEPQYMVRKFYWFFIRGWKGWAPVDTWSLDIYLDIVIRDSVNYLRKNTCGYPMGLSEEEWDNILHRISFLADRHLGMIEMDFKYTPEEYEATTKELFDLLGKYWGNLWD